MLIIIGFLLVLFAPLISAQNTHGQIRTLYEPFNSSTLNTTIWNDGYPWGSYYNHRANTVPRQAKITPDGFLNLTAMRERSISLGLMTEFGPIDLDFTSGAVNTNGKFCIKNGFVEVSLRVGDTESTWASVFLVPEDQGTVPMLTVMEVFNSRSRYSYGFKYTNDQGAVVDESRIADKRITNDGVHRYLLDWGYDELSWYCDDQWVHTMTKSKELQQVNNMCLVIGFGVGGKSKDTPIDIRAYPSTMSIDLVEIWQPKYDGFYKFQNVQTGLLMEIDGASLSTGARVLQWTDLDGDWQKWHVQYAGHGQFRLILAHSRKGLDINGWGVTDGAKLVQWDYVTNAKQLWKIQVVDESSPDIVQLVNVYSIGVSTAKMVSVPAGNPAPTAQLELWRDLKSDLQKWRMIKL